MPNHRNLSSKNSGESKEVVNSIQSGVTVLKPVRTITGSEEHPESISGVTVVIPAHNEEHRISRVIETVLAAEIVQDVIVVNDGSSDGTSVVARNHPNVRVIDLPINMGKGGAMLHGARAATNSDVLVFLDGDLINLKPEHVCALADPVLRGLADMAVGQFRGGRGLTDLAQKLVPYISGQRAIRRDLFLQIPDLDRVGFGIEMAITFYVKHFKGRVMPVMMRGVTHPMKEEKLGFVRGMIARMRMYRQMLAFALKYSLNPPRSPRQIGYAPFQQSRMNMKKEHQVVVRNGRGK